MRNAAILTNADESKVHSMQDMVERIVEMDKRARELTDEAKKLRVGSEDRKTQRQLDAIYAEKGDEWVARIVARATGDDK